MSPLRWIALLTLLGLSLVLGTATAPVQPGAVPIDHVVVIFMENQTFDKLLGLYPGADGLAV